MQGMVAALGKDDLWRNQSPTVFGECYDTHASAINTKIAVLPAECEIKTDVEYLFGFLTTQIKTHALAAMKAKLSDGDSKNARIFTRKALQTVRYFASALMRDCFCLPTVGSTAMPTVGLKRTQPARPVILEKSTETPCNGPNFYGASVFEELLGLPNFDQAQQFHSSLTSDGPVHKKWKEYLETQNSDFVLNMGIFNMKEAAKFGSEAAKFGDDEEHRNALEIVRNMQTIAQETDNFCTGVISEEWWAHVTTSACSTISDYISQLRVGDDNIIADLDAILDFVSDVLLDKEKRKNDVQLYRRKVLQFFRKVMSDLLWANLKCITDKECGGKYKRMFFEASKKPRLFNNAPVVPPTADDPAWAKDTFYGLFTTNKTTQELPPSDFQHGDLIWRQGDLTSPGYDRDGNRIWEDNASLVGVCLLQDASVMMTQRRITDGVGGRFRKCFTNPDTATPEESGNPSHSVEEMEIGVQHLFDPLPLNERDIKGGKVGQVSTILSSLLLHHSGTRALVQNIVETASAQQSFFGACMADVVVRGATDMVEQSGGTMVIPEELREEAKGAPKFGQESDVSDPNSGSDSEDDSANNNEDA
jgi:hypothetical protein